MKRAIAFMTVFVAIAFMSASATIINIPGDYGTIQAGIDASSDGDTVLVQPGTYVENINFNGHNIVLGSLFLTTGDTSYISTTVIDGDATGSVVTFMNGEESTTLITGFMIQNGYANAGGGIYCRYSNPRISNNTVGGNSATAGGGIYCRYSNAAINNNTISGNVATGQYGSGGGGGIHCRYYSSPTISTNNISGNSANAGGGIYCRNSNPMINDNIISENIATGEYRSGGGIHCRDNSSPAINNNTISGNAANEGGGIACVYSSNPSINNNAINGNIAYGPGGGIACYETDPTISNNSISENYASNGGGISCVYSNNATISNNTISQNSSNWGGGIYCLESSPTITNNTISGNSAHVYGAGIYCQLVSNPVITNTIFWADSAQYSQEIWADTSSALTITYCDIQDTLWPGEGNISVDPLFRDPENGDFHLMADSCGDVYNSPCIDAGDPAIFDSMLDCDWGLGELRSDMGAYGGEGVPTDVDEEQMPEIPMQFLLSQNYPNPFNASTIIQYSVLSASDVTINIYDILGRTVETLIQGQQPAGYHQITWDANDRSSGLYFYRIQAGGYAETKKMVVLR